MTSGFSAVLVAVAATASGEPACTLPCKGESVVGRLVAQLHRHGVTRVHVLTRPDWQREVAAAAGDASVRAVDGLPEALEAIADLAGSSSGSLLLAHADLVVHDGVVDGLIADPRVQSGILSATRTPPGVHCPRVRMVRGRVVSAESAYHQVSKPTHAFLGVCKLGAADRGALVEVARELHKLVGDAPPEEWDGELARKIRVWGIEFYRRAAPWGALAGHLDRLGRDDAWMPDADRIRGDLDRRFGTEVLRPAEALHDDPVSLCVTGLVRREVLLRSAYLRDLYWARPFSENGAADAERGLDRIDEDKVLLDSAVKAADGFFTTYFVSPYSKYIARWCARRGLTPNQVTTFSMFLGIVAAGAFALGNRPGLIAGAVLLQLAFTFDCVDGQLARYTRRFSKLGAWLDSVFDRGKEYVVYAGLAWGFTNATGGDGQWIWLLAAAALGLQTARHYVDFGYGAEQHGQIATALRAPLERPRDVLAKAATHPGRAAGADREDFGLEAHETQRHDGHQGLRSALGGVGVRLSSRFERLPAMRWFKRILVLPIGERFALISVTAAVADARVTFLALLVWGAVAATYTVTGRALRSVA